MEEKFAASSGKKEARKLDAKHKKKLGLSPAPSDIPNELLNNSPKKKVASPEKSTGELFKNIVEKSKLNKSTPTKDNGKCKDKAARPVAAANSNGNTTVGKELNIQKYVFSPRRKVPKVRHMSITLVCLVSSYQ